MSARDAKAAHAAWLAEIECRLLIVSSETSGQGADLTRKQAHALAGRWYRWKTDRHAEDPGAPHQWSEAIEQLIESLERLAVEAQANSVVATRTAPLPDLKDPALRFVDLLAGLGPMQTRVLDQISAASEERLFSPAKPWRSAPKAGDGSSAQSWTS